MSNKILSYQIIKESDDWTVDYLSIKEDLKNDDRLPLTELVEVNQKSFKNYSLSSEKNKYITVSSLDKTINMLDQENIELKKKNDLPQRAKLIAKKNDILISKVRPESSGIALITDNKEYVVSNAIIVLTPKKKSLAKLLYFILSNEKVINEISSLTRGTTNNLPLKLLNNYSLPISKIPEEKIEEANRIYDEHYKSFKTEQDLKETIDKVFKEELISSDFKSSAEENKFLLADYKKHLLNDQFSIEKIFYEESKEKWNCREEKLKDLIGFRSVRDKPGKNQFFSKEIPRVTISEMIENDIYVDESQIEFVQCEEDIENDYLEENNIILPKMAASLKKVSIAGKSLNGAIVNQNLYVIDTHEELNPEYLALFLKSKWGQRKLQIMASGTTIQTINRKNIENLSIPFPDKSVQKKIVEKIKEEQEKNSLEVHQKRIKEFQGKLV
jgi:restriction endonuclease S subunit